MSVITVERLSQTVGAEVRGVDTDTLLHDEKVPAQILDALEEHGALVFHGLHLTDSEHVTFSKRLGRVETFGKGALPEIV